MRVDAGRCLLVRQRAIGRRRRRLHAVLGDGRGGASALRAAEHLIRHWWLLRGAPPQVPESGAPPAWGWRGPPAPRHSAAILLLVGCTHAAGVARAQELCDVLAQCLMTNPADRPSAKHLLRHRFFSRRAARDAGGLVSALLLRLPPPPPPPGAAPAGKARLARVRARRRRRPRCCLRAHMDAAMAMGMGHGCTPQF